MTGVEWLIVDLVATGEAPLYPTYVWVGRRLGRATSLREFLQIVAAAVEADVLRLWNVDPVFGDRTELFSVPPELASRYEGETTLDESYDPFALSLTLGVAADVDRKPRWEVSLDFDEGSFELIVRDADASEAIAQVLLRHRTSCDQSATNNPRWIVPAATTRLYGRRAWGCVSRRRNAAFAAPGVSLGAAEAPLEPSRSLPWVSLALGATENPPTPGPLLPRAGRARRHEVGAVTSLLLVSAVQAD